jgi:hypothetical protein
MLRNSWRVLRNQRLLQKVSLAALASMTAQRLDRLLTASDASTSSEARFDWDKRERELGLR